MNDCLNLLLETLNDPAPGLFFDKHKRANAPKRAYRSRHASSPPSTVDEIAQLNELCGTISNGLDVLVDLYTRHNGVRMYQMPNLGTDGAAYAIELYPLKDWDAHTTCWTSDDLAWAMDDCPLYKCGPWRVIGTFGSEAMSIVMFFGGEYKGIQQTGRCYCLGLDGYLGYEEELAENFEQLAIQLSGKRIVDTLDRVGFTGFIQTEVMDGRPVGFGDVVKKYLPDVTRNRYLVD